jgi:hypothetical protein
MLLELDIGGGMSRVELPSAGKSEGSKPSPPDGIPTEDAFC